MLTHAPNLSDWISFDRGQQRFCGGFAQKNLTHQSSPIVVVVVISVEMACGRVTDMPEKKLKVGTKTF